jgi:hypothetical protein
MWLDYRIVPCDNCLVNAMAKNAGKSCDLQIMFESEAETFGEKRLHLVVEVTPPK